MLCRVQVADTSQHQLSRGDFVNQAFMVKFLQRSHNWGRTTRRRDKEWTLNQWKSVLWYDESKFEILGSNRHVFVRRRKVERMVSTCENIRFSFFVALSLAFVCALNVTFLPRQIRPWACAVLLITAGLHRTLKRREAPRYATLRREAIVSASSIFSARRERIAPGNTLKNELYVWSRSGIAGSPAWGNARPV